MATLAAAAATMSPAAAAAQTGAPVEITVMTRNLYLGADVGVALALLPDFPAAAQFMWDQMRITDFDRRAPSLAAEVAASRPDVIGLQEATTWRCSEGLLGGSIVVFDFLEGFLAATEAAGVPYVVAAVDGREARNPGFAIGPLPGLSVVRDPETFRPLFGSDTAACGFEIGDALLVRADLADAVRAAGTTEFERSHAIVPWLFEIERGYAWADVEIDGATVRFVTTHLESLWTVDARNVGPEQARQLVGDLAGTELPTVVLGDFNNDPRDPRPPGAPNPGGQPEAGAACAAQVPAPTPETAVADCNAYWVMVRAGYVDVGPDAHDPANLTWGGAALLDGPDPLRVEAALAMGNEAGFTDRLDYVFVRNGVRVERADLIGAAWPDGDSTWRCDHPLQVAGTAEVAATLSAAGVDAAVASGGVCLATDHAGIVATLSITPAAVSAAAPVLPTNDPWLDRQAVALTGIAAVLLGALGSVGWGAVRLTRALTRRVRGRRG